MPTNPMRPGVCPSVSKKTCFGLKKHIFLCLRNSMMPGVCPSGVLHWWIVERSNNLVSLLSDVIAKWDIWVSLHTEFLGRLQSCCIHKAEPWLGSSPDGWAFSLTVPAAEGASWHSKQNSAQLFNRWTSDLTIRRLAWLSQIKCYCWKTNLDHSDHWNPNALFSAVNPVRLTVRVEKQIWFSIIRSDVWNMHSEWL